MMTITSGIRRACAAGGFLLAGLGAFAQPQPQLPAQPQVRLQAQPQRSVLDLSDKVGRPTFPVAAYQGIGAPEFRSMVRQAFQQSGFSFVAVDEQKNKSTVFKFKLDVDVKTRPAVLLVSADELLDGRKKCSPCFLRFAEVSNAQEIKALPWMAQYDLSARLVPAIDKAYATIESAGREHLAPSFGFNYKRRWEGEQNLFGNSFVGISVSDLKESIVRAYRSAGFVPVEDDVSSRASELALTFSFPVDPAKEGGVVYQIRLHNQYDEDGRCHPCEVTENYDPYQPLPPSGLSGVLSRATLESRFTAARNAAYDNMRTQLERHLRPRSVFSVPPKRAPLGSPPPAPTLPVVT